ncbi:MAG TPA: hypothetical protein ENH82_01705 [bacterium]|nr:hypothetical protein [bacterium]
MPAPKDPEKRKIWIENMSKPKSQKHKDNISEGRLGIIFSQKHKDNLSKSQIGKVGFWTGKKRSPEDIEKFRQSHLGKKQSQETIYKRMKNTSGKNHYNWKGGLTPVVRQVRRCFKYRQWRSDVFTRDNFTCVLCGKEKGWIEADHYPRSFSDIFYENMITNIEQALDCEEFWNINNGRTLCRKCHNETKGNPNKTVKVNRKKANKFSR